MFKVGDKVKVIYNVYDLDGVKIGNVYTVVNVRDTGDVDVENDFGDGCTSLMFTRELELYTEPETEEEESPAREYAYSVQRNGDEVYISINGILSDADVAQILAVVK
jgi:hypothetical protein